MRLDCIRLPGPVAYTGAELRPHWIAEQTGSFRSALAVFRGPCSVATGELVDLADRKEQAVIEAREMLHFLGEFFGPGLELAIAWQRLLIAQFAARLQAGVTDPGCAVLRVGDDIFVEREGVRRKLSVSIVTASPVSTLLHFGVNIDPAGAPVPAVGLQELGVDPDALARVILEDWTQEMASQYTARCKVTPR